MKTKFAGAVLTLLAFQLVGGGQAIAQRRSTRQAIRPNRRPALSPYLDLLGKDGTAFSGQYFRRVRPEVLMREQAGLARQSIASLRKVQLQTQRGLLQTQGDLRSLTSLLGATGHSSGFLTHRKYFGTRR